MIQKPILLLPQEELLLLLLEVDAAALFTTWCMPLHLLNERENLKAGEANPETAQDHMTNTVIVHFSQEG